MGFDCRTYSADEIGKYLTTDSLTVAYMARVLHKTPGGLPHATLTSYQQYTHGDGWLNLTLGGREARLRVHLHACCHETHSHNQNQKNCKQRCGTSSLISSYISTLALGPGLATASPWQRSLSSLTSTRPSSRCCVTTATTSACLRGVSRAANMCISLALDSELAAY